MRVIQTSAKADPDGVLRLQIPLGAAGEEFEVAVVLVPTSTSTVGNAGSTSVETSQPACR